MSRLLFDGIVIARVLVRQLPAVGKKGRFVWIFMFPICHFILRVHDKLGEIYIYIYICIVKVIVE
jgi:hypothetical protein